MINSVLGPISIEDIGITSPHEHILIDMRNCVDIDGSEPPLFYEALCCENRAEVWSDPYAILDNALLSDIDDAISEMAYFKKWGGKTIVDCTLDEIGRNAKALKEISLHSGVNIILGCGHYYHKAHFPYVKDATLDSLCEEMYNDITVGIQGTDIKAGIIGEIGTSAAIGDSEKKVLTAAGIVAHETGKAIHVHTDLYTENGYEIIKLLTAQGVTPEKICIDHVDVWLRPDYIHGLLSQGVFIEFDNFGKEFIVSRDRRFAYDLERIILLEKLIHEGYKKQILISNDICLKSMWKKYGGLGYAHILRTIRDISLQYGIDKDVYLSLLTDNVKNFLN